MDKYFAFDLFERFPDDLDVCDHAQYTPGGAKTEADEFLNLLVNYGQCTERVELIRGSYKNSITKSLAARFSSESVKMSLVIADCNLYKSHKPVFAWVDEFLQLGKLSYFDDLNCHKASPSIGPKLAWGEYKEQTRCKFESFIPVGWCGYSFIVC